MLDHFRIVAVMETEAETWFSDARVATAVTVLASEDDANRRDENLVRFVQFRTPLPRPRPEDGEAARQSLAEALRDSILSHRADFGDARLRVRVVQQNDLYRRGLNGDGHYVGSKWGRYLRAIDSLYELHKERADRFCTLNDVALISRGVTTNCDDFFIVTDVTQQVLDATGSAREFQMRYNVRRADVVAGRYRIVQRDDGVVLPMEPGALVETLKTARDVYERQTSAITNDAFAVNLSWPRAGLSRVAEAYLAAGEREHWHERASFNGREDWYVLRDTETAPILFVKTIQYSPQVLWNDANLLPNQRLYKTTPRPGIDGEVLAAVLNSTVFAVERFAAVKALGREAANDVEVSTARVFRIPDFRRFGSEELRGLREAFREIRNVPVRPLLEAGLIDAGLNEARVYVSQHAVSEDIWPEELRNPARQEIDRLILRGLGLGAREADEYRRRLYCELVAFTRKAKLLELEAQINRRGGGRNGPGLPLLADDLWADITAGNRTTVRTLPNDFIGDGMETETVDIPTVGRASMEGSDLFDQSAVQALRFGRDRVVRFDSQEKRDLCLLLAENGVRGHLVVPTSAADCRSVREAMRSYLDDLLPKLEAGAAEITENTDLRQKIVREAMKRLLPHRR